MGKKKRTDDGGGDAGREPAPFNNPFGALHSLSPSAVAEPLPTPAVERTSRADSTPYAGKLVLRRQRKGHGGKTVTLLQGVAAGPEALSALARELAKVLGTAARVEGGDIALSGDQGERLASWLRGQGAKHVVMGS